METEEIEAEMSAILSAVQDPYDLATEILWTAMHALKRNHTLTIPEAIAIGKDEWDV